MQTISSKDNPRLKAVRALVRSKKDRQAASAFVMEGVRALSALADGTGLACYQLKEIWVSDKVDAASLPRFAEAGVPLFQIPHDIMEQLSDCRTSQGILGVVEYSPQPLEINLEKGNYLLLDGVMDPGNMGTLIRSAVAFGFDGILLHGDCVEVFNPKTVRATMGALPFSNVWKLTASGHSASRSGGDDFSNDLKKGDKILQPLDDPEGAGSACFQCLEKAGYDLIATVLHGGENLHEMKFGPKNVLVIGNEARGVSKAVQQRATRRLSIPMSVNVESLNAAVAGSICMFSMQGG